MGALAVTFWGFWAFCFREHEPADCRVWLWIIALKLATSSVVHSQCLQNPRESTPRKYINYASWLPMQSASAADPAVGQDFYPTSVSRVPDPNYAKSVGVNRICCLFTKHSLPHFQIRGTHPDGNYSFGSTFAFIIAWLLLRSTARIQIPLWASVWKAFSRPSDFTWSSVSVPGPACWWLWDYYARPGPIDRFHHWMAFWIGCCVESCANDFKKLPWRHFGLEELKSH